MPRSLDEVLAQKLVERLDESKDHPNDCICHACEFRLIFEQYESKNSIILKNVSKMVH